MVNIQSGINPKLFRAYDIRGHIDDLTAPSVYAIACALVDFYQQQSNSRQVVIGYDARLASPSYAYIIQQVFENKGFNVVVIGRCSSPMLYFSAQYFDGNGIMVTASHNPKHDNGIKWICQAKPPSPQHIQDVGKMAEHYYQTDIEFPSFSQLSQFKRQTQFPKYFQYYQDYILKDIDLKRPFKIVLDGLNGSAGRIAERLLNALNCEIIELRCDANGHFPHHAPDPSVEAHLTLLKQAVIQHQAELGIALDGDGDRLVIVNAQGEMLDADRMLCLFAEICLKNQKHQQHEFVYDVKCSTLVKQTVESYGGTATMIRTGSSFLRNYLLQAQGKAIFAGEFSGHYAFYDGRGLGYDDAIYAGLRILEYLSQHELDLNQVMAQYPKRIASEDIYINRKHYDVEALFTLLRQQNNFTHANMSEIDGLRFDFQHDDLNGFFIIRASNTSDNLTVRIDANSQHNFDAIQQQLCQLLHDDYPMLSQAIMQIKAISSPHR